MSKRTSLRVDVPDDEDEAGPSAQQQQLDLDQQGSTRPKFSPGTFLNKTASFFQQSAALVTSKAKEIPSKTWNRPSMRLSVNPISRAAGDAQYRTSVALATQDQDVSTSPAPRGSGKGGNGAEAVRIIAYAPTAPPPPPSSSHLPHQGGSAAAPPPHFVTNKVITSKYNIITFLPVFLFEMFSRVAYLYFLIQAGLSWWSVVSPYSGIGATAALLFVLIVAGVKAVWEDMKRHQEDQRMNTSITHKIEPDGSVADIPWTDVKVGDAIMVKDEELFPADLLCLHSHLADNVCFIKTTNLDGETNLKIRKPLDLKQSVAPSVVEEVVNLDLVLKAELPNRNLHKFKGSATIHINTEANDDNGADRDQNTSTTTTTNETTTTNPITNSSYHVPVTMNEMLLRGCMLKNSGHIVGLVVYTGKETRIQMNAAKTPLKVGSFDRFLNLQIALVILMQLLMCLLCAVAGYIWNQQWGLDRPHLALSYPTQGIYENGFVQIVINFLTFWILLSYLVPISLFVTLEIVKFWQGFVFINLDPDMKDPKTKDHAYCRNSNLNEDLGKVEYIFSDKTGTLTSNEMQLRMVSIKGVPYGTTEFRIEEHPKKNPRNILRHFDPRLYAAAVRVANSKAWKGLVTAGGSKRHVMGHHTSYPSLGTEKTLGIAQHDWSAEVMHSAPSLHSSLGGDEEDEEEEEEEKVVVGAVEAAAAAEGGAGNDLDRGTTALGHHMVDYWTNVLICQSLILEENPNGGLPIYQGPSPDEVALVDAARRMGFVFKARAQSTVTLSMLGEQVVYEILNIMEYSSERGCMSVIAKAPDGTIRLYCKGADSKVMKKIRSDTDFKLMSETEDNLTLFARQGLRTLVLGTKIIPEDVYSDWDARYQEAAMAFEDRDARMDALGAEVENSLELIGVTAIEDKLQDGVPAAIATLLTAGIRVWMITGDKQETAVNISVSCRLVGSPEGVMMLNVDEKAENAAESASQKLDECLATVCKKYMEDSGIEVQSVVDIPEEWQHAELAVDGPTLTFLLADPILTEKLAVLSAHASGVVISRSSPSQKAAIVRMMKKYEMNKAAGNSRGVVRWYKRYRRRLAGKMLSIGDGANDVAMLQTADVGIGIAGKEGRQAVNNSDYAISQFRFLVPLLLVHGNLSYYRLARLIKYSFYKNITFAFMMFFYQFYNGFSGQALIDSITAAMFNVVFTSLPILLFAVLDRPVKQMSAFIRYPQLYNKKNSAALTTLSFWKTGVLQAIAHSAIIFFIPYYGIVLSGGAQNITDVYSIGKVAFVALLGSVTLEVALIARYWTWLFGILTFLSYFLVYPYLIVFSYIEIWIDYRDPSNIGVWSHVFSAPSFWLVIFVCYVFTFGTRLAERTSIWLFRPHDTMILAEKEEAEGGLLGGLSVQQKQRLIELGTLRRRHHSSGYPPAGGGGGADGDDDDDDLSENRDTVAGWDGLQPRLSPSGRGDLSGSGGGVDGNGDGVEGSKNVRFSRHERGPSLAGGYS